MYLPYIDEEHFTFHPHLQYKHAGTAVRLVIANMKNCLTPKIRTECATPKLNKPVPCCH